MSVVKRNQGNYSNQSEKTQHNEESELIAKMIMSLNFASEQNGSPEDRYFSFYITHKGLADHKAR